jgi:hypothetical protein
MFFIISIDPFSINFSIFFRWFGLFFFYEGIFLFNIRWGKGVRINSIFNNIDNFFFWDFFLVKIITFISGKVFFIRRNGI